MDIDIKGKIGDGKKLLHDGKKILVERMHETKHILSEEEINKFSLSKVLNRAVEDLGENRFNSLFLQTTDEEGLSVVNTKLVFTLYEDGIKKRNRRYICSIHAGHSEAINAFEESLKISKIEKDRIRRIGLCGFWHYIIECKNSLKDAFYKDAMLYNRYLLIKDLNS